MLQPKPRAPVRVLLRKHMPQIEALLVQWLATERISGSPTSNARATSSTTDSPASPPDTNGSFLSLEAEVKKAREESRRKDAVLQKAYADKRAAAQALEGARPTKGKGQAKVLDSLTEALRKCEIAVSAASEASEKARSALREVEEALAAAKLEAETKAKLEAAVVLEAKLRGLHQQITGRHLPCRLPHVLEEQCRRLRDPRLCQEILLTWVDMVQVLKELRIIFDVRGLRALFSSLSQARQPVPRVMRPTNCSPSAIHYYVHLHVAGTRRSPFCAGRDGRSRELDGYS
ncbi:hypothetical protein AB1Y20_000709 [Prymnesium parvum]|uniref:Centrosomal protein of 70 kDa n=1 Tax=Prymnesium parvum TaxID=97485 RepID=A0AB34K7C8_PRYPA